MGEDPSPSSSCVKALLYHFCCHTVDADENEDTADEINAISIPLAIACCGGRVDQTDNDETNQDTEGAVGEHRF